VVLLVVLGLAVARCLGPVLLPRLRGVFRSALGKLLHTAPVEEVHPRKRSVDAAAAEGACPGVPPATPTLGPDSEAPPPAALPLSPPRVVVTDPRRGSSAAKSAAASAKARASVLLLPLVTVKIVFMVLLVAYPGELSTACALPSRGGAVSGDGAVLSVCSPLPLLPPPPTPGCRFVHSTPPLAVLPAGKRMLLWGCLLARVCP
jgi:hypothetical protein